MWESLVLLYVYALNITIMTLNNIDTFLAYPVWALPVWLAQMEINAPAALVIKLQLVPGRCTTNVIVQLATTATIRYRLIASVIFQANILYKE